MIAGSHKLARTPPSNPKRKLENDFDERNQNTENDSAKKLNLSARSDSDQIDAASKFERNMFEAQFKEHLIRINKLEQELMHSKTEKENLEYEHNNLKKKQEEDKRDLIERNHNLEMALKSTKSNNEILNGELKHLMEKADTVENGESEKQKENDKLKTQIEELLQEKNDFGSTFERKIDDLKYQLESKNNELEQSEIIISKMKESSFDFKSKYDTLLKENTTLQNKIKDLEEEISKLKDNSDNLNNFMDQSSKIDNLEREKRRLVLDLETAKANQDENLIIKEKLNSKDSQIERYEKKIVATELENSKLQEKISELNKIPKESTTSTMDIFKQRIKELDLEVIKSRESYEKINQLVLSHKKTISERDEQIRLVSNQLANTNTERNCYKKMVTDIDAEQNSTDATKFLEIQVRELQNIINQYKKIYPDLTEMKLCNDTSIHLEELNAKNISVQVDLNSEIYSNYELTIVQLQEQLKKRETLVENADSNQSEESYNENSKNIKENLNNEPNLSQTNEELQIKVKTQSERIESLLKEFHRKSSQVLRAFRSLVGFKVKINEKVVNLICERKPENYLSFRICEDFSLSLIDTSYAKENSVLIEKYLKEYDSIPTFLHAIFLNNNGYELVMNPK